MYRVKIYGAGSIGNHLAHAARMLGWEVTVADINTAALDRMRNEIYPLRYGKWDDRIELTTSAEAPRGGFDFIFVGTPPLFHIPLALDSLEEKPRAVLLEKPLCTPGLENAQLLWERAQTAGALFFVGYDHVVAKVTAKAEEMVRDGVIGEVTTIDVSFREHWEGIFNAHPWLDGPAATYLGYWREGGGALGEHSHALNLWQHFAHVAHKGRVAEVDARLRYVRSGKAEYDDLAMLHLKTETGLVGRVVQDVVSRPHRKGARIQGSRGALEWVLGYSPQGDALILKRPGSQDEILMFPKTRPDDFIQELKHLVSQLEDGAKPSGICLERGMDTMLAVAAAHKSEQEGRRIRIDYGKGYTSSALL